MSNQAFLDFGNRLWGASTVIFIYSIWHVELPIFIRILSSIVMLYFLCFGAERFTKDYRKIL